MTNQEALRMAYSKRKDSAGEERDFLNTIIQALEQTRWIPVSERLPEIGQRVLVTYNQEDKLKVDTTIFDKHGFLIGVVTVWMSLPQPYKAESEG